MREPGLASWSPSPYPASTRSNPGPGGIVTGMESRQLSFTWEGLHLVGTLHLPDSPGSHPAVLMMQGSGPSDRDNDGYFVPLRNAFIDAGIAVYSFDKPGVGQSTGEWRDHALEGRASQSTAALENLAGDRGIDSERLGVWGHSQGGWLVQMLASRLPELSFAITNSGPAIGIEEQDLYGCEHTMRDRGHPEDEIEEALAFLASLHGEARRGTGYEEVEHLLLREARSRPWYGYLAVDDDADWGFIRAVASESYDPITALRTIRCPYLALFGAMDLLVPAWESARATAESLNEAGNRDATIVVFPGTDHRIQDSETGRLPDGYLDLVAGWAAHRVAE